MLLNLITKHFLHTALGRIRNIPAKQLEHVRNMALLVHTWQKY